MQKFYKDNFYSKRQCDRPLKKYDNLIREDTRMLLLILEMIALDWKKQQCCIDTKYTKIFSYETQD